MAYTAVPTITTGDVATAAWGNTYIKDNFAATSVGIVTTAGDLSYASAANALTRLAIGAAGTLLRSTGSAPEWADPEDGAKLDGDKIDIDFTPTYYTPATTPAEADDVDDLAAHLYGIDEQLNQLGEGSKAYCTVSSGGTLQSNSSNITSIVKNGTGDYTVTINNDFANANWAASALPEEGSGTARFVTVLSIAVGTVRLVIRDSAGTVTDTDFHFVGHGTT